MAASIINPKKRTLIITVALVFSVILYIAGVYSGLYANHIIEAKTEEDINSLKIETEKDFETLKTTTKEDLESLQNYIDFLETTINNIQLEQNFVETLSHEEMCEFSTITLNDLVTQIRLYWQQLPFRIEKYERENKLSSEYIALKKQYTEHSIRTWVIAKNKYTKCGTNFVLGLYFYSSDCTKCVAQGEELDLLQKNIINSGRDILLFTVDLNSDNQMINYIKEYYEIKETPAIILNDQLFQGRLFTADELEESLQ